MSTHFSTPEFSIPLNEPLQQLGNTHHMVTTSKVGVFKPNVLAVEIVNREPHTIDEAFSHEEWKLAMQVEYDALI